MRKFLLFLFVLIGLAVVAKQSQKGSSKKNLVEADGLVKKLLFSEPIIRKLILIMFLLLVAVALKADQLTLNVMTMKHW